MNSPLKDTTVKIYIYLYIEKFGSSLNIHWHMTLQESKSNEYSPAFSLELLICMIHPQKRQPKKGDSENFSNDVNETVNDLIRSKCWSKVRYA